MQGQIMIDKNGWRWIHVEEAHIYFMATKNGADEWVVAAFRSDGFYGNESGPICPMMVYLKQTHQFTTLLEVPEHIVEFAIEEFRLRHQSVDHIAAIFEGMLETRNEQEGFRKFVNLMVEDKIERNALNEQQVGAEIFALVQSAGGQQ